MKKYIEIGNRIRRLRAHLLQKDFAAKLKVPLRTYKYYESGERVPKMDVLARLSVVSGMPIDWILKGEHWTEQTEEEKKDDIRRWLWQEGEKYTEEDIERIYQKQQADKRSEPVLDISSRSPDLKLHRQLDRIIAGGNKKDIEGLKGMLNALDPGESLAEGAGEGTNEGAGPKSAAG